MKQLISSVQLSFIIAVTLFLSACAETPKKEADKDENKKVETSEAKDSDEAQSDTADETVSYMLPSPIQIAAIFNRAGLEYQEGLLNPPQNVDKYNTKTMRYLNFGIYSADLAYAVLNDKQQASMDQLKAVKKMSDAIGMSSVFGSGSLIKSFEENIGNQDTILRILTTIKRKTDAYLEENGEKSKDAVFFSAAWIEGMYLGSKSIAEDDDISAKLIEQMTILENIINAIEVQDDPTLDLAFVINGLKQINDTFKEIPQVKKFNNGEIELEEVSLKKDELHHLKDQIVELRSQIVNG